MADYTTLDKVKAYHSIGGTNQNAKITQIIPYVTSYLDDVTGRFWQKITVNAGTPIKTQAKAERQSNLFLPGKYFPIISLSSLKEDGVTLVVETDYELYPEYIKRVAGFWDTRRNKIEVAGDFGVDPTPPFIEMIATEMAGILALEKTKTFTTGDGVQQTITLTSWPTHIKEQLETLRIKRI